MKHQHLKGKRDEKAVTTQKDTPPKRVPYPMSYRSASRSGPMSSISIEVAGRGAAWRIGSTRNERFLQYPEGRSESSDSRRVQRRRNSVRAKREGA